MRVITLREPAKCADCGRDLPAGTTARYYSRDKIYCEPSCGGKQPAPAPQAAAPAPMGGRAAVLVFLKRLDAAIRELIDSLERK